MKKRVLCAFLSMVFMLCAFTYESTVLADEETTASQTDRRDEIQRKLDEYNEKLEEFDSESKDTEEYIEVLEGKIKYLSEQYSLAKKEYKELEEKTVQLEDSISVNKKEIKRLKKDAVVLEEKVEVLTGEFTETYKLYCKRIRALYISGEFSTTLSFLLEGGGFENILTRYEMISSVSKKDGELLEAVKTQTEEIMEAKQALDDKNKELTEKQEKLKNDKESLKTQKEELLKRQEELNEQQIAIEEQQLEANERLKTLHEKTQEYGEYRDIAQAELDAIDDEIAAADRLYEEETTVTTTTTTTTRATTRDDGEESETETTEPPTEATTQSGDTIRLTYPCPSYTTITCGFGDYAGHTGCDFSTRGNENQRIVAAESGTVILVRYLETSYGHYIVIRHDKLTPSGKTVYTLYAHNNDIIVSPGDYVTKGQQIAYSGTTGNSTGPHLHFEVRVGGSSQSYAVDPEYYLP